jgi:C1A family cysteine protease
LNTNPQFKLGVIGASPRGLFPRFSAPRPFEPKFPWDYSYDYDFPPVWDQKDASDCVANATCAVVEFYLKKYRGLDVNLSRAAVYQQGKLLYEAGDFDQPGMYPASALKLFQERGAILEKDYPSTDANINSTSDKELKFDPQYKISDFTEVENTGEATMEALHEAGPCVFALDWANSFFTPNPDGTLPAYDFSAGGHCVALDGGALASMSKGAGLLRNSWGDKWGIKGGKAWISLDQITQTALNIYTIKVPHK